MNYPDDYQAALSKAAFFIQPQAGLIQISGPDQEAFLQRQTTNDIGLLVPGKLLLSVLTSPTARILDVLLLSIKDQDIQAIPLPGKSAETTSYLRSRIFFMDKVNLQDRTDAFVQVDILGPEGSPTLESIGLSRLPAPGEILDGMLAELPCQILGLPEGYNQGVRLLLPATAVEPITTALQQVGASPISPATWEILRIEAGLPSAGYELTQEYTPLEAGLQSAISATKGCYTGQEVIARQITYDKITQHLCGVFLDRPAQPGATLLADQRTAGTITSTAESPHFGTIGLAVIRREHSQPGNILSVKSAEPDSQATVTTLPFKTENPE
jgi:folate-binding protein YgfZ